MLYTCGIYKPQERGDDMELINMNPNQPPRDGLQQDSGISQYYYCYCRCYHIIGLAGGILDVIF